MSNTEDLPTLDLAAAQLTSEVTPVFMPVFRPLARHLSGPYLQRLLGFWMIWHTYGDVQAIVATGVMSRPSVYRTRTDFRAVFGCNVEDWQPDFAAFIAGRRPVLDASDIRDQS